jgi:hypothetical protein
MRIKIFIFICIIFCSSMINIFAYDSIDDNSFVQKLYSKDFVKTYKSKFGEQCWVGKFCGNMFELDCGNRIRYFLNFDLTLIDPNCSNDCTVEPASWLTCMKIKSYKGDTASQETQSMIKSKYGADCQVKETCANMSYVDCNSAADGPAYYLDHKFEIIGTSGGLCMGGRCSGAPKEWESCTIRKDEELKKKFTEQE